MSILSGPIGITLTSAITLAPILHAPVWHVRLMPLHLRLTLGLSNWPILPICTGFPNETQTLHLSLNQITSVQPGDLSGLPVLNYLDLYYNSMTSIFIGEFSDASTITTLDLSCNLISYIEPGSFLELNNLQVVYLGYNQLSNLSPNTFPSLPSLYYLDVSGNYISVLTPGTFAALTNLQYLILASNLFTSVPLVPLALLRSLIYLDVGSNQIAVLSPGLLSGLNKLQSFLSYSYPIRYDSRIRNFQGLPCVDVRRFADE